MDSLEGNHTHLNNEKHLITVLLLFSLIILPQDCEGGVSVINQDILIIISSFWFSNTKETTGTILCWVLSY